MMISFRLPLLAYKTSTELSCNLQNLTFYLADTSLRQEIADNSYVQRDTRR